MKQENYDYLKNQVYYAGFKDTLHEELRSKMEQGEKQFIISHQQNIASDQVRAELQFNKSDKGYYFFDRYKLELTKESGEKLERTIYMAPNNDYTLKEAYNLLNGRSVEKAKETKDGEKYKTWDQFDLTTKDKYDNYPVVTFGQKYGFDLEKELQRLPIPSLANADDMELITGGLKRGNRQVVNFEVNGEKVERRIEANPKMRRIDVYDANGEKLTGKKEKSSQELDHGKNENKNISPADDDGPGKKGQGKKKGKGAAI